KSIRISRSLCLPCCPRAYEPNTPTSDGLNFAVILLIICCCLKSIISSNLQNLVYSFKIICPVPGQLLTSPANVGQTRPMPATHFYPPFVSPMFASRNGIVPVQNKE